MTDDKKQAEQTAPTAEKRTGEWIAGGYHPFMGLWYQCSVCGGNSKERSIHCPNCGIKMTALDGVPKGYFQALDAFSRD